MCDSVLHRGRTCQKDLDIYQTNLCSCKRCERARKFSKLLNHLTIASKMINYEEQISAVVTTICEVRVRVGSRRTYNKFRIILGSRTIFTIALHSRVRIQ